MNTFRRYLLVQAPSWAVAAVFLFGVRYWLEYPAWLAALILAVYIGKDFALYPFLRKAYESAPANSAAALIGQEGVAEEDLAPRGYVRIRGELWQAEIARHSGAVRKGEPVEVRNARGLTLIVARRSEPGL